MLIIWTQVCSFMEPVAFIRPPKWPFIINTFYFVWGYFTFLIYYYCVRMIWDICHGTFVDQFSPSTKDCWMASTPPAEPSHQPAMFVCCCHLGTNIYFYLCMCACVNVCHCVPVPAKSRDALELKSHADVNHLLWMLGIKLRYSEEQ